VALGVLGVFRDGHRMGWNGLGASSTSDVLCVVCARTFQRLWRRGQLGSRAEMVRFGLML
jgi:hypothetical protein